MTYLKNILFMFNNEGDVFMWKGKFTGRLQLEKLINESGIACKWKTP